MSFSSHILEFLLLENKMPRRRKSKALRKKIKRQAWEKNLPKLKYRCSLGIAETILNDHTYIKKIKEFYDYHYDDYEWCYFDNDYTSSEPELSRIPSLWLAAIELNIPDVIYNFEDEKCPCQTIKFLNNEKKERNEKYYVSEEPKDIQEYLHIAIEKNRIDCVKALLKKSASPNRLEGIKSLNNRWIKWKKELDQYEQDRNILREKYDKKYPDNTYPGGFRFYCAHELGQYDWDGQPLGPPLFKYPEKILLISPLRIAAQTSIEMTRLLIESGANPLDTSLDFSYERGFEKTKNSAIYYANSAGKNEIVKYLHDIMTEILSPKEAICMLLMDDKNAPRKYLPVEILEHILQYAGKKDPIPDFSSSTSKISNSRYLYY